MYVYYVCMYFMDEYLLYLSICMYCAIIQARVYLWIMRVIHVQRYLHILLVPVYLHLAQHVSL